jgi:hypothetical protein
MSVSGGASATGKKSTMSLREVYFIQPKFSALELAAVEQRTKGKPKVEYVDFLAVLLRCYELEKEVNPKFERLAFDDVSGFLKTATI